MRTIRLARGLVCATFGTVLITHCVSDGGLNQNEREAGGGDQGVDVGVGELAIDPTGEYLLSMTSGSLTYADLSTGAARHLPGLTSTQRVTFDHQGRTLFLTRRTTQNNDEAYDAEDVVAGKLVRYDLDREQALWSNDIELAVGWEGTTLGATPWLAVTEDDSTLIVAYDGRVEVVDARTGTTRQSVSVPEGVVDVDVTQTHVVITKRHSWIQDVPHTELEIVDLETFAHVTIDVPNCADELVVTHDSKYAFLAPTRCQRDPVSVIDLSAGKFVRNLPGFGPVALAADGALAVAFIDAENIDEALFDDPKQIPDTETRYHLMLIDTTTLRFDVIALGDELPRYAVAPDGKLLLIDSARLWVDGRIRLLDVADKQLVPVLGPSLSLNSYVVTRDSKTVFLLDAGLYTIALSERVATAEPIEFTPTHLNITPDDGLLVLREDDDTLWLYDVQAAELRRRIELSDAE